MNSRLKKTTLVRKKRAWRVRKKIRGTAERPRLSVHRSLNHLQVQLIDDENGKTIAGTATFAKDFRNTEFNKKNKASAAKLGEFIGKAAQEKNITEVVFDRGSCKYHGVIAELANAARANGLKF